MTRSILVLVLACAVALAGCAQQKTEPPAGDDGGSTADGGTGTDAQEAPRTATYVGADYAISGPAKLAAGWVDVTFRNDGREPHEVFVSRLAEGKTYADFQALMRAEMDENMAEGNMSMEGDTEDMDDMSGEMDPWDAIDGGPVTSVGAVGGGMRNHVRMRLAPGNYVLQCWIPSPDGTPHAMKGMVASLEVVGAAGGTEPTGAEVTLTYSGDALAVEPAFTEGRSLVKAVNTNTGTGEEGATGLQFVQLEGNATAEEFFAAFEPNATGPPPGTAWGGLALLPAGATAYFDIDLEPGRYVIVSFAEMPTVLHEFEIGGDAGDPLPDGTGGEDDVLDDNSTDDNASS